MVVEFPAWFGPFHEKAPWSPSGEIAGVRSMPG